MLLTVVASPASAICSTLMEVRAWGRDCSVHVAPSSKLEWPSLAYLLLISHVSELRHFQVMQVLCSPAPLSALSEQALLSLVSTFLVPDFRWAFASSKLLLGNVENPIKCLSREMSDVHDSKLIRKLLSANQCAKSVWSVQTKGKGCGGTLESSLSRCAGFQSVSSGIQHIVHDVLCAHLFHTEALCVGRIGGRFQHHLLCSACRGGAASAPVLGDEVWSASSCARRGTMQVPWEDKRREFSLAFFFET